MREGMLALSHKRTIKAEIGGFDPTMLKTLSALLLSATAAMTLAAAPAAAQSGNIGVELNSARALDDGCRLTYVITNSTASSMGAVTYEVAMFDLEGVVTRLLVFEFGELQTGKTKVMQFVLPESPCESISRLLVNSVTECSAADGSTPNCLDGLVTSSKSEIQFGI